MVAHSHLNGSQDPEFLFRDEIEILDINRNTEGSSFMLLLYYNFD